jgi:hypothetical protein
MKQFTGFPIKTEYAPVPAAFFSALLPEITDIVYDYNMHIVAYEKEKDDYKKKQILTGIKELEARIDEIFKDVLKK